MNTGQGGVTGPGLRTLMVGWALVVLAVPASAAAASPSIDRALDQARAPAGELQPVRTVTLAGGTTVHRYRQRVGGAPVLRTGAVVSDPPAGRPTLVADVTHENISAPSAPKIERAAAIELARSGASVTGLRAEPTAQLAVRPSGGGTLVWVVDLPAARPLGDFEVLVDARTGEVLAKRDLLARFQTGRARLYAPNPVAEMGGYLGLKSDHHNTDTKLLNEARESVALRDIDDGQNCLVGAWVTAKLHSGRRDVCRNSLDWRGVTRSRDRFEALMAYFHIDRTQRYVQSLDVGQPINERSTPALADAIREDNSYYSPFTGKITYGRGGVDDAEDADVIVHEYGHALQDAQIHHGWSGSQGAAMGEGFGDYMAMTMTAETPDLPDPTEAALCIFDWDGISYSRRKQPCGRRSGISKGLDDLRPACRFDPHCVGRVWSSALWSLRNSLGTDGTHVILDRILLYSGFLIPTTSPTFKQAGDALIEADQALYGGGHHDAIEAELQRRDIL